MILRTAILFLLLSQLASAAENSVLNVENYGALAPGGKEADAIYGDFVLRNDQVVAVVAAPVRGRRANLTVRNVGGALIDFTERTAQRDQLSAFFPGGGAFRFDHTIDWPSEEWGVPQGATLAVAGRDRGLAIRVGYELRQGEPFVRVVSTIANTTDAPAAATPADGWRLDGPFEYGAIGSIGLGWAHEVYWRQAYGVQTESAKDELVREPDSDARSPRRMSYRLEGSASGEVELAPGASVTWRRRVIVAPDSLAVQAIAREARGERLATGRLDLTDGDSPVEGATITIAQGGEVLGYGVSDGAGQFTTRLPPGEYVVAAEAQGHERVEHFGRLEDTEAVIDADHTFRMSRPGYVEAQFVGADPRDEQSPFVEGYPALGEIAVKVEFIGVGETPSPDFGPDSAVHGVQNLRYTPDGSFRCKLLPGKYRYVATHGPEYNAVTGEIEVEAGKVTRIDAPLFRVVDTTGWLSSELHSHSSPSGDNTASQAGRVLNLLAEHLEFCPCTEHQRIDVYDEHLATFAAQQRMLTCPGMELTGGPLPLNHQNAFPLRDKPHTQDGGGPRTHSNPVEQIKRLAGWDDGSEKLVQTNHPDIAQMVGDRDQDNEPDEGFEAMFGFMDVIEVHPPELIFEPLRPDEPTESGVGTGGWDNRGNAIVNWLQLLNLGYRVTGVVNTDAHYNHHGSGWMRNWVKSSTDDPAKASVHELVHEFEHGHVVMSNGPFMEVTATAAGASALPGDDLSAADGKAKVRVVVRCPNWIEVNRVQLFLNGRAVEEHNVTARSHGDLFSDSPNVLDHEFELELDEDTHVVAVCCGEGQSIGKFYGGEAWGRRMPVAVANPVFIDVDGDADGDGLPFEPNRDGLGLPLPTLEGLRPSHGHSHANHAR